MSERKRKVPKRENIWNKIKKWFENRFIHPKKALQEPSENIKDNIRNHYKVTTVDQMTMEELNQTIKDRDYFIEDDVIFAEILKRIGANPELISKTIANNRAKQILSYHLREGELVQLPSGKIIFEDIYTIHSIGEELPRGQRTTVSSDGTSIGIKNTEAYGYYQIVKTEDLLVK